MVAYSNAQLALLAASFATLVASSPLANRGVITVPLSKRNTGKSTYTDLMARDKARIAHRQGRAPTKRADGDNGSATVTNGDQSYYADVSFCGTSYSLIVDTGSSNTWAGAGQSGPSDCGSSEGASVSVGYGSGQFSGDEYVGSVSFAGLTVDQQSFGVATSATGFTGSDGIFGVGPVDLTQNTVDGEDTVPTFLDNLYSQGSIQNEVLGVYFHPESGSDQNDANGELTLGGVDSSKYTGDITYAPLTSNEIYSPYWGIDIDSISSGNTQVSDSTSAIVDTGTTLVYIPTDAYNAWLKATGGKTDSKSGLPHWTKQPTDTFTIQISGTAFTLTPEQYLIPKAQYKANDIKGTSGYYSFIGDGGDDDSQGPTFTIGQKFLENYYSVFDTTNSQVGFATAA